MLQAMIREITLEGPGAGGIETASPSSPTWSRSSARPAPASSRTIRSGATSSGWPRATSARRYLQLRVLTAPASSPPSRGSSPSKASPLRLVQQPASRRGCAAHRHPRGAHGSGRGCARGDPRAPGLAGQPDGDSRRLAARRRGARERHDASAAPESSRSVGMTRPLIERFRDRLPVTGRRLSCPSARGRHRCWPRHGWPRRPAFASCGSNGRRPTRTGSQKDRGMTVAVSKAEDGAEAVICASTGNTAASAAAYATRAGLPALVLTPQGAVSGAKLAQTRMLGAMVLESAATSTKPFGGTGARPAGTHALVNSLNPELARRPEDGGFRGRRPRRPAGRLRAPLRRSDVVVRAGARRSSARRPPVSVEAVDRRATLATAIR